MGASGRISVAVKVPFPSVAGAGNGRAPTPPIVIDDTDANPGKLFPVTTSKKPGWAEVGLIDTDAPGTVWVVLVLAASPDIAAVTLFEDGIFALNGTLKVTLKSPVSSGATLATCVPA